MKTNRLFCKLQKFNNAKKINPLLTLLIAFFMTFSTIGQTFIVESDCLIGPYSNLSFEFETQNTTGENLGDVLSNGVILASNWKLLVIEADPTEPIAYFDANNPGLGTNYTKWVLQQDDGTSWFFTIDETFPTEPCNATWVVDTIVGGGRPCTTENLVTYCTGETPTWYEDLDGDGFGNSSVSQVSENQPIGYVLANNEAIDCNDNDSTVNPGATEIEYDGIDNDCSQLTPDDDLDNDGFVNAVDCDDANPDINSPITYYVDADLDGFGSTVTEELCVTTAPDGYSDNNIDCNDNDININPDATEVCDGIDNNCDGNTNEGLSTTYYADVDQDGFGDPSVALSTCDGIPTGYVEDNTDCFDNGIGAETAYPGASEIPGDLIDNDCDGEIDEDDDQVDMYEYCNAAKTKVLICHKGKKKCVSINAVDAHLAHGDSLGSCDQAQSRVALDSNSIISHINTWPNPTNNYFNVRVRTTGAEINVNFQVYDINGRLVQSDMIKSNLNYRFGERLSPGLYFVKIAENKLIKIIKQ